jgi:hypothetical protein
LSDNRMPRKGEKKPEEEKEEVGWGLHGLKDYMD